MTSAEPINAIPASLQMENPDGRRKMELSAPPMMPRITFSSIRLYTTREPDASVLECCKINMLLFVSWLPSATTCCNKNRYDRY